MKAWKLAIYTVLISTIFSIIPSFSAFVGIDFVDYNHQGINWNTNAIAPDNSIIDKTQSDMGETISLFSVSTKAFSMIWDILKALLTANHYIIVAVFGVPEWLWTIYALYHYLTLTALLVYLLTNKQVEV